MRGSMSRLAAATLIVTCLSVLPAPLHAKGGHHEKATATMPRSGATASSSTSSLGRLLAYDLPLPHDWIREYEQDVSLMSQSYSYSFSYQFSPTPVPTVNPTTTPVAAPTVQPEFGSMPIVTIMLLMAGTPEQQQQAINAIIAYLIAFIQQIMEQDVVVTALAPEPLFRQRILQTAPEGRLCLTDAPQNETSIDMRNYDDVEQVQKILAGIMNGTIVLTAVNKDGSSMPVKDSICRAETKLSFAPPPIDTLDDKGNVEAGPKPLSALYIALIAVASVSVLFAAIFLIRRRNTPKARSAVVAATSS